MTTGDTSASGGQPEAGQTVIIRNQRGLHARAAAKFVKLAGRFDAAVEVRRGDTEVSGLSIMGLMMLAAGPGTSVELRARGAEAEAAVAALADLILRKFDED
ncbi:HPr family phosphocarrier protein [Azospirillum sp. RWY-5-1]|uniref:HPr family phosphocarrier protein n=1 Tax=Azospirillum oleiclasticum TaxID=2735135 RepID=A0ABX2TLQ2_9PROT|nr:HPr family phosphocarrier protein [Azospirillum oleiclasticum]NYZ17866.1 HPr family phosphocarrier protein [Azospirillum oleiclasticum]NYZ25074.1 HPr family phosphocarrier protein [Azospirillum oleiclasticum]